MTEEQKAIQEILEKLIKELPTLLEKVEKEDRERQEKYRNIFKGFLKFFKKEVEEMPEDFRKKFKEDKCLASMRKYLLKDDTAIYEIRFRRYGYDIIVSAPTITEVKQKFIEEVKRTSNSSFFCGGNYG